jgi:hypothetical protein
LANEAIGSDEQWNREKMGTTGRNNLEAAPFGKLRAGSGRRYAPRHLRSLIAF